MKMPEKICVNAARLHTFCIFNYTWFVKQGNMGRKTCPMLSHVQAGDKFLTNLQSDEGLHVWELWKINMAFFFSLFSEKQNKK